MVGYVESGGNWGRVGGSGENGRILEHFRYIVRYISRKIPEVFMKFTGNFLGVDNHKK